MNRILASEKFTGLSFDGQRFDVCIELSYPTSIKSQKDHSIHFECLFSVNPLLRKQIAYGENSFQSLCMALKSIRDILRSFVADGGRVYWRDTNYPVDLNSPWFEPMYALNKSNYHD